MKRQSVLSLSLLLVASSGIAGTFQGTVYPLNSDHTKPVLKLTIVEEPTLVRGTATQVEDQLVTFRDETVIENGVLKKYSADHVPALEKGSVEVQDKKILFTYTKAGATTTATEGLADNFVVGGTLRSHMKANWQKLLDGETLSIRFGVLDRLETVGFKLFKDSETEKNGVTEVIIKMKPTSIIIAALVDPLYFAFDKKTVQLRSIKGRSMSKVKVGDQWKPYDGDTVYTYTE